MGSVFVFRGTKTSKRDRKEETAKFVIDLSEMKLKFRSWRKRNFAVGQYEKFRRNKMPRIVIYLHFAGIKFRERPQKPRNSRNLVPANLLHLK